MTSHESVPIVSVVDDDESFRRSTVRLVEVAGFKVRGFASAHDFLAAERPAVPSCLVLDVRMPGLTGLELQRHLAGQGIEIIFMTGHGDIPMSVRAMKAGAVEFLTKPFAEHALLDAIRQALDREQRAFRERAELAEMRRRLDTLTPREREVMLLVVRGLLNKQVAAELGIREITVKVHRHQVMTKMHASSLAVLVRMCERLELLNPLFTECEPRQ
jgi:FixJ family two-component response regulator